LHVSQLFATGTGFDAIRTSATAQASDFARGVILAPLLVQESLRRSMEQVDFARVVLFTSAEGLRFPSQRGVETIGIEPLRSSSDYSRWVVRSIAAHIQTSHVLISQWAGFVTDAQAWSADFLNWDYIGAVWPDQAATGALATAAFPCDCNDDRTPHGHCSSSISSRGPVALPRPPPGLGGRPRHFVCPPNVACCFSYENEKPRHPTFGFRGSHNLPRVTAQDDLVALCLNNFPMIFPRP
jgi:hypothetical protein